MTHNTDSSVRRFIPVTLAVPVLGSALGIDGGAIFQIFASEDLGLSAAAIGSAFGLGILSLPVQLWAARMPLWRARRNLQSFLGLAAAQAFILALLVAGGRSSGVAAIALGVTVTAEISLSVLYATAWQPLLSLLLSSRERQQINSRVRALGGGLLAASVLIFAALDQPQRSAFLVVVGAVAVCAARSLRRLPAPARPKPAPDAVEPAPKPHPIPTSIRKIYVVIGLVNVGALPLLLVYIHQVLWPAANLELVGALQLTGSLVASLAWRPTVARVIVRARVAAITIVTTDFVIAALHAPLKHRLAQHAMLLAVVIVAAGTTTVRIALLELAHRSTNTSTSVRAFTLLDVVASTSVQIGLFASGLLVTASSRLASWAVDPYRIYIATCGLAALLALTRLRVDQLPAGVESPTDKPVSG